MASEVKRYDHDIQWAGGYYESAMQPAEDGDWVRHADYAALEAQLAALQWTEITEDNLPTAHDTVQLYSPADGVQVGYMQRDGSPRWFYERTDSQDERIECWPTHYAPLLNAPAPQRKDVK